MEPTLSTPATPADWEAMYDLRYRVLRQPWGQPCGSERAPDDPTAYNLLAHHPDGTPVGTARLHLTSAHEAHVRFMAVDPAFQSQGIGHLLLEALEAEARRQGVTRIVLAARETAVVFYKHAGYRLVAPGHLLFNQIPHWQMEKDLTA